MMKENKNSLQRKHHSCNMEHGMAVNPNENAYDVVLSGCPVVSSKFFACLHVTMPV